MLVFILKMHQNRSSRSRTCSQRKRRQRQRRQASPSPLEAPSDVDDRRGGGSDEYLPHGRDTDKDSSENDSSLSDNSEGGETYSDYPKSRFLSGTFEEFLDLSGGIWMGQKCDPSRPMRLTGEREESDRESEQRFATLGITGVLPTNERGGVVSRFSLSDASYVRRLWNGSEDDPVPIRDYDSLIALSSKLGIRDGVKVEKVPNPKNHISRSLKYLVEVKHPQHDQVRRFHDGVIPWLTFFD